MPDKKNLNTLCVHAGHYWDENVPGLVSPIFPGTSHKYPNKLDEPYYPRYGNTPTLQAVANKITALENGSDGLVFSSGIAAISSSLYAFLQKGDHAVIQSHIYGGAHYLLEEQVKNMGVDLTFVDGLSSEEFESAIKENTKVIYIETPSNPLLKIIDIEGIAKIAKAKNIITIIDNTFATPINQRPLDLGIDIVVHSATKYMGGHSDILAGAMVCNSKKHWELIRNCAAKLGGTLDAFAAYRLERSLKTLALRMERHNENAMKIAEFLEAESKVKKVHFPGLKSFEGHEIAKKQMIGFGAMMSFDLNMEQDEIKKKMEKLKYIAPALSLGGVESIISFPDETSHALVPEEIKLKYGITKSLVRFSVGIEDVDDLIEDLKLILS